VTEARSSGRSLRAPYDLLVPGTGGDGEDVRRMTVFVRGRVQGVGFRWWTRARALELGLVGHARNTDDGRVEVVAEGRAAALQRLVDLLTDQPSGSRRPGHVESVSAPLWDRPRGATNFLER
jgi:acylphosphatase